MAIEWAARGARMLTATSDDALIRHGVDASVQDLMPYLDAGAGPGGSPILRRTR